MSIIVEHEKRRGEILEKALDVFTDEGFEDTTFQKIADRCGITRTTLYIYFKNKKDIFSYSIKQLLSGMENDINRIRKDGSLNSVDKIIRVISDIIDKLEANRRILRVILDYLLYISRSDTDPDSKVRRRTLRLRHILATMVIEGIRRGEIAPVNVRHADDLLYGLVESAIFRLVVLKRKSAGEIKQAAVEMIRQFGLSGRGG